MDGHGHDVFLAEGFLHFVYLLCGQGAVGASLSREVFDEHVFLHGGLEGAVEAVLLVDILAGYERSRSQGEGREEMEWFHEKGGLCFGEREFRN